MNQSLAAHVLDTLAAAGVQELCLCAGARNSPLIVLAAQDKRFRAYSLFEERSAAFFGLGRIKAGGLPVAVVTTSGTAAGELLPATMEAYYSGLPLVLVTADRPRRFRGTGAPQSAEQAGLLGVYVEQAWDIAEEERINVSAWSRTRPLHVNVCFDEPLLAPSAAPPQGLGSLSVPPVLRELAPPDNRAAVFEALDTLREFLQVSQCPIVVVGALAPSERPPALQFLSALGAPVILESLSGLREQPALELLSLRMGKDALVPYAAQGAGVPWMDGVLRLGGVPTLRLWRDLESSLAHLPLLSLSSLPFAGASRGTLVHAPLSETLGPLAAQISPIRQGNRLAALLARDRVLDSALTRLLHDEPQSEPGLIHAFSRYVPEGARVYLGNSLPIREWDLAAARAPRRLEIGASRGLNGIDGQISTFLGFSKDDCENWALLGDLTALYDMAGPWILRHRPNLHAHIAIINNGGGKIFDRMFADPVFQNTHDLGFEHMARFWGLEYARWETVPAAEAVPSSPQSLVEIVPDEAATRRFWQAYDGLALERDGRA